MNECGGVLESFDRRSHAVRGFCTDPGNLHPLCVTCRDRQKETECTTRLEMEMIRPLKDTQTELTRVTFYLDTPNDCWSVAWTAIEQRFLQRQMFIGVASSQHDQFHTCKESRSALSINSSTVISTIEVQILFELQRFAFLIRGSQPKKKHRILRRNHVQSQTQTGS